MGSWISWCQGCREVTFGPARWKCVERPAALKFGLLLAILAVAGCSSKAAPESNSSSGQGDGRSASRKARTESRETAPQNSGPAEAGAPAGAPAAPAEKNRPAAAANEAADSSRDNSPTNPAPKPTAEQLARWNLPRHDRLQLVAYRQQPDTALTTRLRCLGDGRRYLQAGSAIAVWAVNSDTPERIILDSQGESRITALAVAGDGMWFVSGDNQGTLRRWDVTAMQQVTERRAHDGEVVDIAISPDASEIATIGHDSEVRIWNADTLDEVRRFRVDTNGLRRILYATPDQLVAAGEHTTCWNVRSGAAVHTLSPGRYNYALASVPGGIRLLFGDQEGLHFWEIAEGRRQPAVSAGISTQDLVAVSSGGKYVATANGSGVRIWELANGQLIQIMDGYGSAVTGLEWLPNDEVLLVASMTGVTRIWSTSEAVESLGMQPLAAEVAMPDPADRVPANSAQMLQTLDLRTFPALAGSQGRVSSEWTASYSVPASAEEVKTFYRYVFAERGWREVPAASDQMLAFRNLGFMAGVYVHAAEPAQSDVSISFPGNYDLRWLPKLADASVELVYENESVVMYRSTADMLTIETGLLRAMHAAGWTPYSKLGTSTSEQPNQRQLEFLSGGLTVRASISRYPQDTEKYSIQYACFPTAHGLPIPADAGYVEFDGSTEPKLVASTALSLDEAAAFYDSNLAAQGWTRRPSDGQPQDKLRVLTYFRGQQDLMVGLRTLASGRTQVFVGADVEKASWQLATQHVGDKPAEDSDEPGIEAADFPILNDSQTATYDKLAGSLEFVMAQPLANVASQYTAALRELGWELQGQGITSEDYVFLTFTKSEAEIELRARTRDGQATVNIQGDGLRWNKRLPSGPRLVSYETWLRLNKHPATLELLDDYVQAMRAGGD